MRRLARAALLQSSMDTQSIVRELRGELERLERAIATLERVKGRATGKRGGTKPHRPMSAEARARISAAMKKRWAAAKKAGKSCLGV